MTDTERLKQIKERAEKATAGPWPEPKEMQADDCKLYFARKDEDSTFIAHARQDIPWLCEQLEAVMKDRNEDDPVKMKGKSRMSPSELAYQSCIHEPPVQSSRQKVMNRAVNDIAMTYDGPPHGGYEKLRDIITDMVNDLDDEAAGILIAHKPDCSRQNEYLNQEDGATIVCRDCGAMRKPPEDFYELQRDCVDLRAKLTPLERENAELRKDKERLDWLEAQSNGQHWIARQSETGRGFRLHNTQRQSEDGPIPAPTARAAIDAALKPEAQANSKAASRQGQEPA